MEVSHKNCEEQNLMDIPFLISMPWQPFVSCFHLVKTTCGRIRQQTEDLSKKAIGYLYPFIADKTKWPHKQDVMYWENWPVAQPFLLFGADAFNNKEWFDSWKKLDHSPVVEEVIRNLPVRNPLIWIN